MSALWYFHHSQGSNCCATSSAAAKHVGNSDLIPSMASEIKHGKADSELRSLLVGLSSDTGWGKVSCCLEYFHSASQVIVKLFFEVANRRLVSRNFLRTLEAFAHW